MKLVRIVYTICYYFLFPAIGCLIAGVYGLVFGAILSIAISSTTKGERK